MGKIDTLVNIESGDSSSSSTIFKLDTTILPSPHLGTATFSLTTITDHTRVVLQIQGAPTFGHYVYQVGLAPQNVSKTITTSTVEYYLDTNDRCAFSISAASRVKDVSGKDHLAVTGQSVRGLEAVVVFFCKSRARHPACARMIIALTCISSQRWPHATQRGAGKVDCGADRRLLSPSSTPPDHAAALYAPLGLPLTSPHCPSTRATLAMRTSACT